MTRALRALAATAFTAAMLVLAAAWATWGGPPSGFVVRLCVVWAVLSVPLCAMGALRIAHVGSTAPCPTSGDFWEDFWEDRWRLRQVVRCAPAVFSDDPRTTAEDVAAAFERAAAAIESQTDDDAGANPGAVPTR